MDALSAFLKLKGLDGGNTHPVTMPDFVLSYEDKDITVDVAPYLISFSYTTILRGSRTNCRSILRIRTAAG